MGEAFRAKGLMGTLRSHAPRRHPAEYATGMPCTGRARLLAGYVGPVARYEILGGRRYRKGEAFRAKGLMDTLRSNASRRHSTEYCVGMPHPYRRNVAYPEAMVFARFASDANERARYGISRGCWPIRMCPSYPD